MMVFSIALLIGAWTLLFAQVNSNDNNIAVMDNCDPADSTWNTKGGCFLKPHQGDVSLAEFGALLFSAPNKDGKGGGILIGHPAWRNEPSYLSARAGQTINVANKGGRTHTFTEVANFGGGFVAPLNDGLVQVPECVPTTAPMPPGDRIAIAGLAPGLHHFQCCIHPWMRATIRVE